MRADLKVDGADQLLRNLHLLESAVSRRVQIDALRSGAEPIRSAASALAPRDETAGDPHLADNIIVQVPSVSRADDEGLFDTLAVFIGPAIKFFYGYFHEVGTAFHSARPFMRPAFDSNIGRSMNIIRTDLWASIRKRLNLGGGTSGSRGNL